MNPSGPEFPPSERPPQGPRGSGLSPGMIALLLVFAAAAILGGIYYQPGPGARARKAAERIEEIREKSNQKMREELDRTGMVAPQTAVDSIKSMRSELIQGGGGDSDDAKAMRVMADYTGEMQRIAEAYAAMMERLDKEKPLDFSTVKTRADFEPRRKLARDMLRVNAEMTALLEGSKARVRGGLERAGVASQKLGQMMAGFTAEFDPMLPKQRVIRIAEETCAKGMLEIFDLVDAEWGRWKIVKEELQFDSSAVADKYNALVQRVVEAGESEAAAQRELLNRRKAGR